MQEVKAVGLPTNVVLDVGKALAPAGQPQHRVREDIPPIVRGHAHSEVESAPTVYIAQAQPIGKGAKSVQSDVAEA